jgi:hypothetical protein
MNVTEPQRHHLYETAKMALDQDAAETLMNLLAPHEWANLATKHDLARLEQQIAGVEQRFEQRLDSMQARYVTWLLTSQATVVAATAALVAFVR